MKNTLFPFPTPRMNRSASRLALGGAVAGLLIALSPSVQAQATTDNFSDGNDTANPTWTHLLGYVGSSGQSWFVGGGTNPPAAYRLLAPNNGVSGLGFVGSYTGPAMPNSTVQVDFINFGGPGPNAVFGVAGRLNGNNAVGGLTGYSYAYEPFASGGLGEMVLYRLNPGISITDIGSQQVSLDPAKDYRFVLELIGSSIHGQVFEIGGGMVAERFATDATYTSGFAGVLGYGQSPGTGPTDFTVDNFSVVPEPGVSLLMGLGALALLAGRRFWPKRV